jgi:hypothetical protein
MRETVARNGKTVPGTGDEAEASLDVAPDGDRGGNGDRIG